jgi:hypothetical protein
MELGIKERDGIRPTMDSLPEGAVTEIFSFLNHFELIRMERVSKRYLKLSREGSEWKRRYERMSARAEELGYMKVTPAARYASDHRIFVTFMLKWVAFVIKAFRPVSENPYLSYLTKIMPCNPIEDLNSCGAWWEKLAAVKPELWGEDSPFFRDLKELPTRNRDVSPATLHISTPEYCQSMTHSIAVSYSDLAGYNIDEGNHVKKPYLYASHFTIHDIYLYCVWRCIRYAWEMEFPESNMSGRMRELDRLIYDNECGTVQRVREKFPDEKKEAPQKASKRKRPSCEEITRKVRSKFW